MKEDTLFASREYIRQQIEWHVQKILQLQDAEGMIPSSVEFSDGKVERTKDIPRQAMATMALSFAQALLPELDIKDSIVSSTKYCTVHIAESSTAQRLYIYAYLALGKIYARQDPAEYVDALKDSLSVELFAHPIALGLCLRILEALPGVLPGEAYMTEVLRYTISITPRRYRFFDCADTVVWAKGENFHLAQSEYQFLMQYKTSDDWFAYAGVRGTASVVAKMFEVFAYANQDSDLLEGIYKKCMSQTAQNTYARQTLGLYAEHILSAPNTLVVDDVHTHILVGLCYYYRWLSQKETI